MAESFLTISHAANWLQVPENTIRGHLGRVVIPGYQAHARLQGDTQ